MATPEVDIYLAALPAADRAALEHVRATIRAAAPDATEGIGYGVPVFRWMGSLIGYGATPKHCAIYVMSPATLDAFRPELKGRVHSEGFDPVHGRRPAARRPGHPDRRGADGREPRGEAQDEGGPMTASSDATMRSICEVDPSCIGTGSPRTAKPFRS